MAEAVLPGQDSLRVDLSVLAEDMPVDHLGLAGDDVVQSEVFVLEASWSLVLLFRVGLDVEQLRAHRVHLVLHWFPAVGSQRVVGRDFPGVEEGADAQEVGVGGLALRLLLRLLQFALSGCQQFWLFD